MAARTGDAVELLIQHGSDIHLKMPDGRGVMAFAGEGALDYFQALLRYGIPFDAQKDGPTILLHASEIGNLPMMKEMIDRGVDPNVKGVWGISFGKPEMWLPMVAAAFGYHPEAAKFLLAHGAKADDGMATALRNRHNQVVKLLWESGARNISELCYQISQGATASELAKLLDAGAPADPPQDTYITPLGEAAQLGNLEAVKLLIDHKANVNAGAEKPPKAPAYYHTTPLCLAAREGKDEIVAYLLQHGATPDPAAVIEAADNSFEKTVRILIDAGALKNIAPGIAGAVLAAPIWDQRNATVLKMLLDAGLSPESPLQILVYRGLKPNSVIGSVREYCQDPANAQSAAAIKPLLDMLEAADHSASASATDANPTGNTVTSAPEESSFYQALERDRTLSISYSTLNPGMKSSTPAADAQMLLAIQKGDYAALKKVLEHAVDPNPFDPDRFYSCPVYWAVHFNRPGMLKLLLEHFATGEYEPAQESPLQLAQRIHPELVPIIE